MKAVLIACSYPPDPVVGSFRAEKLVNALLEGGHAVDVITARLPGEEGSLRVERADLRVHAVREVPGPKTLYRRVKRALVAARGGGASEGNAAGSVPRDRHVPGWRRFLLSLVWVPDDRQGFIPAALWRALPLMRRAVDLVYTTAPPFSDHLVGLVLKRVTGVRWVAEFRDPWVENRNRSASVRSRPVDALNRWLERQCVRHADQLVAVSEGTAGLLRGKLPSGETDRVLLALNGIDNLLPAGSATGRGGGPFRMMHLGNCYGGRDPRLFLRALAGIAGRRGLTARDVRIDFVGHCRVFHGESLEELAQDLGIGELVHFTDWIPISEARARAREADLFLLPLPHHRGIIPNKLFDYLGFRKPILALVHPEGEAARMLERLGGHYLVRDERQESMEEALEQALGRRHEVRYSTDREALLAEWTTDHQLRDLLTAVEALAAR